MPVGLRSGANASPIISERGKTAKTGDSEKMDAEAAFWEERGEGAPATLGKFANDWGNALHLVSFKLKVLNSFDTIRKLPVTFGLPSFLFRGRGFTPY